MLIFLLIVVFTLLASGMAWHFIRNDRGSREPVGMLWTAFFLGFGGALLSGILEALFIPANYLDRFTSYAQLGVATLGIGVIEEASKFLPLALLIYKRKYFNEHTDGPIYFGLAGMGFGLPENILYTIQFGTGAGFLRVFMTPFFHAAITAIVGYMLIRGKLRRISFRPVAAALAAAMLVHAVYNFGLMSQNGFFALISVMVALSVSIGLFLLYGHATARDQAIGLSVVGHNSFCRNCGLPNPRHSLFCTGCGKYA